MSGIETQSIAPALKERRPQRVNLIEKHELVLSCYDSHFRTTQPSDGNLCSQKRADKKNIKVSSKLPNKFLNVDYLRYSGLK